MSFRTADLPFDGQTNRFIVFYVQFGEIAPAASRAGITSARANLMLRKEEVRAEIRRRQEMFHQELAKLDAQAAYCIESMADAAVVRQLETGPPAVQMRAAELLYKKIGVLKDKVEHSGEGGGPMVFTLERIEGKAK